VIGASDDDLVVILDADEHADELPGVEEAKPASGAGLPENAKLNEDGSVTLTLSRKAAIKYKGGDGTIVEKPVDDVLVFNRLTGGDLRAMMSATGPNANLTLFNRSTKLGEAKGPLTFDALDAQDASAALAIIGFFTSAGRRTGR
jgi:hypothetical protein